MSQEQVEVVRAHLEAFGSQDDASWVMWQDPQPGSKHAPGTAIDLWTVDQPAPTTCPAPP